MVPFSIKKTKIAGTRDGKKVFRICTALFTVYQRVSDGRTEKQTDNLLRHSLRYVCGSNTENTSRQPRITNQVYSGLQIIACTLLYNKLSCCTAQSFVVFYIMLSRSRGDARWFNLMRYHWKASVRFSIALHSKFHMMNNRTYEKASYAIVLLHFFTHSLIFSSMSQGC